MLNLLADSIGTAQHSAAGELSSRVLTSVGQQDLLHAAAARPAGQGERRGDAVARCSATASELAPLKRLIIEKTEGNPFFMEETVQVLLDEGALVRNGAVKLTRSLTRVEDSADGAGDSRRAHRPAAAR